MRRFFALALALCLALPLTGCAKKPSWRYELDTRRDAGDYTARDGTLLSWYGYELPYLRLLSDDAAPGAEPPEDLAAARDAFNAAIERWHAQLSEEYHDMEQMAIGDFIDNGAESFSQTGNCVGIAETYQTARLLSVRMEGYSDWGGAYPWSFVRAWAFDLETGEFVQWYDLAKEPDALRAALAAEVIRQAREQRLDRGFYDGWEEEAERFDGCEVYLGGEALTVVFSEQLLGPRAAGRPEFSIAYGDVSQYFNDYGKQLLKKEG